MELNHDNTSHLGLIITLLGVCFGNVLKILNSLPPVPIAIISYFQLLSFTVAIIAGLYTIRKNYKSKK